MNTINPKQLKEILDGDQTVEILDVRSAKDYEHNHIPHAVTVPFDESFAKTVNDVLTDTDVPLVVYDEHEKSDAASRAANVLSTAGFEDVSVLSGGIMAWMEAGFQVEFGQES